MFFFACFPLNFAMAAVRQAVNSLDSCLVQDDFGNDFTSGVAMEQEQSLRVDMCGGGGGGTTVTTPTYTSSQYLSGGTCKSCSSAMTGCSTCS